MTWPLSRNEPLPHVAFDIDQVARLTGLSVAQLTRWDRNGFFHPAFADPNRRRPYSRIYSENDVVVLRIVAMLREAGVPLARLTPVVDQLAPNEDRDLARCALYVVGKHIFFALQEATAFVESGKTDPLTVIDVGTVIAELEEGVQRLGERQPDEIGKVIRKRGIMSGVPIVAGTRIPTDTIAWFHDHGYSLAEILENFPRLTPQDVDAAVAFESKRQIESVVEPLAARG